MGRGEVHTGLWWETCWNRSLVRPRSRWEDAIKMDLQKVGWEAWTGLIWFRMGTGGGQL